MVSGGWRRFALARTLLGLGACLQGTFSGFPAGRPHHDGRGHSLARARVSPQVSAGGVCVALRHHTSSSYALTKNLTGANFPGVLQNHALTPVASHNPHPWNRSKSKAPAPGAKFLFRGSGCLAPRSSKAVAPGLEDAMAMNLSRHTSAGEREKVF